MMLKMMLAHKAGSLLVLLVTPVFASASFYRSASKSLCQVDRQRCLITTPQPDPSNRPLGATAEAHVLLLRGGSFARVGRGGGGGGNPMVAAARKWGTDLRRSSPVTFAVAALCVTGFAIQHAGPRALRSAMLRHGVCSQESVAGKLRLHALVLHSFLHGSPLSLALSAVWLCGMGREFESERGGRVLARVLLAGALGAGIAVVALGWLRSAGGDGWVGLSGALWAGSAASVARHPNLRVALPFAPKFVYTQAQFLAAFAAFDALRCLSGDVGGAAHLGGALTGTLLERHTNFLKPGGHHQRRPHAGKQFLEAPKRNWHQTTGQPAVSYADQLEQFLPPLAQDYRQHEQPLFFQE